VEHFLRMPELAGELEARLDGFRAAVAEKRSRHPRQRGQPRRQLALERWK
jgi:hypothetical protein